MIIAIIRTPSSRVGGRVKTAPDTTDPGIIRQSRSAGLLASLVTSSHRRSPLAEIGPRSSTTAPAGSGRRSVSAFADPRCGGMISAASRPRHRVPRKVPCLSSLVRRLIRTGEKGAAFWRSHGARIEDERCWSAKRQHASVGCSNCRLAFGSGADQSGVRVARHPQLELARRAGISLSTVKSAKGGRDVRISVRTAIETTLSEAGILFLEPDDIRTGRRGMRFRQL